MAIDLFPALKVIGGNRNHLWYDGLSDEDKKSAQPFVLARWLTGTADKNQILNFNRNVNPYVFSLGSEKPLLFRLMSASSTGVSQYKWIPTIGSKPNKTLSIRAIMAFYGVSSREAILYAPQISKDDIMLMANELGWPKEEVAALKKEVNDGTRSTTPKSSKSKK